MKKIVCELCEGTVFDKVDGRFVCKGCGTSYSAEEARGMMREVEGDEPVATGASVMPQVNPNQQQIENILILASTAYEASNHQEAENYCNKAIELDATSNKAWFLKGKAVGWSSTIGKLRIEEAAHSFCKAIDFAPEDERDSVKKEAVEEIQKLGKALVEVRKSRFIISPQSEVDGFKSDMKTIYGALIVMMQYGSTVDLSQEFLREICAVMYEAGVEAADKADEEYSEKTYPTLNDYSEFATKLLACAMVVLSSIELNDNETDEVKLERYKKITSITTIAMQNKKGDLRSIYKQEWSSALSKYVYNQDPFAMIGGMSIVANGINDLFKGGKTLKDIQDELEKKVEAEKEAEKLRLEEEKKRRIEAYWEAHADEKTALEAELKDLEIKKNSIDEEMANLESQIRAAEPTGKVPSEEERDRIRDQISDLNNRRAKLGLFAGKEKKQIGEEIATLEGRKSALEGRIEGEKKDRKAEAEQKCAPLKEKKKELADQKDAAVKRIDAINKELTKDPEE